jgi:hypothetical protein
MMACRTVRLASPGCGPREQLRATSSFIWPLSSQVWLPMRMRAGASFFGMLGEALRQLMRL